MYLCSYGLRYGIIFSDLISLSNIYDKDSGGKDSLILLLHSSLIPETEKGDQVSIERRSLRLVSYPTGLIKQLEITKVQQVSNCISLRPPPRKGCIVTAGYLSQPKS